MAQNGISYVGRLVNKDPAKQTKWGQSGAGQPVLEVTIAEDHQERNDRAPQRFRDNTKATDAWVTTNTSWHRVTMFGDLALEMATDPDFNHGALVEVQNAQYREEEPWETKDGVKRAGRPETIGKDSYIGIFEHGDRRFTARDEWNKPIHPGGEIPPLKGQGRGSGGGGGGREYRDDEGF